MIQVNRYLFYSMAISIVILAFFLFYSIHGSGKLHDENLVKEGEIKQLIKTAELESKNSIIFKHQLDSVNKIISSQENSKTIIIHKYETSEKQLSVLSTDQHIDYLRKRLGAE